MKNKKIIPVTILVLFAALIIYVSRKQYLEKVDIENNLFTTPAYVYEFGKLRNVSNYYYYYFYNGIRYTGRENIGGQQGEACVGKYFKVSISTVHPEYSLIDLTDEVTDRAIITKAGF